MWKDPIVEEIHAIREQLAKTFDDDLRRMMAYLREQEQQHPERLIGKEELERRRTAAHDDARRQDAA
jgi:hypothetical protein